MRRKLLYAPMKTNIRWSRGRILCIDVDQVIRYAQVKKTIGMSLGVQSPIVI